MNAVFQMVHYAVKFGFGGGSGKRCAVLFDVLVFISIICPGKNLMIQTPCLVYVSNRLPRTIRRVTGASGIDDNSFKNSWGVFIVKRSLSCDTSGSSINSK